MIPSEMLKLAAEKGVESTALNPKGGDIPTFEDKIFKEGGLDVPHHEKDYEIPTFAEDDTDALDGQDVETNAATPEGDDPNETASKHENAAGHDDGINGDPAEESDNSEEQADSDAEEELGLTDEEKARIKEETGWSDEIIDHIDSMEQYEIYKNADLEEREVDGRLCLCKKIDMDYVDPKTGMTNRERLSRGLAPIDAKTGEKIELHHMGQDFDGPFVELCENSEHGDGNHGALHPESEGSWRNDSEKKNEYNQQRQSHWEARSEGE